MSYFNLKSSQNRITVKLNVISTLKIIVFVEVKKGLS